MKLTEIVVPGAIVTELTASERDDVLAALVDALAAQDAMGGLSRDEVLEKLLERERKASTGFGQGVAVPHVKHPSITRIAAAVGLSRDGIDFDALDKKPVYSVFLLLSPGDQPEEHLQAMEAIFKNLSKDTFRRMLRQAQTPEDVTSLLQEADNQQLAG